jgi:riboflavin kinase/FMN adenylyltransferase
LPYIYLDKFEADVDSSVAIGIFDGVHLGHQRVLTRTNDAAMALGLRSIGLTFDSHPSWLRAPEIAPGYISSLSQKFAWMTESGLTEYAVVVHFDSVFAELTPREFVERVLVDRLHARTVRVGADFRFGKDRSGSVMDLESMGEHFGFTVAIVPAVSYEGERISSTRIRKLIAAGSVALAARLLGRPFVLRGKVVRGKQLGATIGFPTANVTAEMPGQLLPLDGVYSGYGIVSPDKRPVRAAISVGVNPTTDPDGSGRKVEAFLMDGFDDDLYGQSIDLAFTNRIRDAEQFDSVEELVAQIRRDVDGIAASVPQVT